MKKITFILITTGLLLMLYPMQAISENPNKTENTTLVVPDPPESAEASALLVRLDEINAMDKSGMKSAEKRVLRKEVRSIKQKLTELGGGVYISVGAVIIILLLIIILL
jgi:hypothetical protein